MSESQPSQVFLFDNSDPAMKAAYRKARATFRFFWREVAWERRRIVPALDLACVKAPFSDGEGNAPTPDRPDVEQMWLEEIDFDGEFVSGALLNTPNWVRTIKAGDAVRFPLGAISDWMYAIRGEVYGAFTVNLLRSQMSGGERRDHDAAWGLNFGDPNVIRLMPEPEKPGGLRALLSSRPGGAELQEHPMSEAMASPLKAQLAKDPALLHGKDDRGWTLLHHQALAGSAATVTVLLESGADPEDKTDRGLTPLQLAESLGWGKVAALLAARKPAP